MLGILSLLVAAAWGILGAWNAPAALRVATGHARFYDPLRLVAFIVAVNVSIFNVRRLVFGSRLEGVSQAELMFSQAAIVFSILCTVAIVIVIRGYEKTRP